MTDELERIRTAVKEAHQHVRNLLRSPYSHMSPWAITNGCIYENHPTRKVGVPGRCVCGQREEGDPA